MRVSHAKLEAPAGETLGPEGTDVLVLELLEVAGRLLAIVEHEGTDGHPERPRPVLEVHMEPAFPDWVQRWVTRLGMEAVTC